MESVYFVLAAYFVILFLIGYCSLKRTTADSEDFFLASRSFGTIVLFFTIFATNNTAVALIGAPSAAYHMGPSFFGYFVGPYLVIMPLLIITVGYRVWASGIAYGYITPAQILDDRFGTTHLGTAFMALLSLWTIPYLQLGIQAGGVAFEVITKGGVSYELGAFLVAAVVAVYVTAGGMRGTSWTNVFQGTVFVVFLVGSLFWIGRELGGAEKATQAAINVAGKDFLHRGASEQFDSRLYLSFGLMVPLAAFMFPQLLVRYMTAGSARALQQTALLLIIATFVTWFSATTLGFWGRGAFPGLSGAEADFILPMLVVEYLPVWVAGFALAGVLAAIMSSMDAQSLTLGTMITEDVVKKHLARHQLSRAPVYGRITTLILIITAFMLALLKLDAIIGIADFAFPGYALLFLPFVSIFYSEKVTAPAVWAALLLGPAIYLGFVSDVLPTYLTLNFHAWVIAFGAQAAVMTAVSFITKPPVSERVERFMRLHRLNI